MKYNILLLGFVVFSLSSCSPEDSTTYSKDKDLYDLLESKSPTGTIEGLMLASSSDLHRIPQDPKNPLNIYKVELGKLLFHETGLAIDAQNSVSMNTFSCASCHHAAAGFQSGLRQGISDGGEGFGMGGESRIKNAACPPEKVDVQPIKSPSVLNVAYQDVMLWNGQFGATGTNAGTEASWKAGSPIANNHLGYQGIEVQALAGFDVHRLGINKDLLENTTYKLLFEKAFPNAPKANLISTQNIALAIAAYERTLLANKSPYQSWLHGDETALTDNQKAGMQLFFSKAECSKCHNGPALNSMEFYALGMKELEGADIIAAAGAAGAKLGRGGFTNKQADNYKFKVPQIYNIKDAHFYGHGASFSSILQLLEYKNAGKKENNEVPDAQLAKSFYPLHLSSNELSQLADFIENGLYDASVSRYLPNSLPSGNCFPNNDPESKKSLCP